MVSSKHIPKYLTSKFRTKCISKRSSRMQNLNSKGQEGETGNQSEQIFAVSDMPYLPRPSSALRNLLLEFNSLNTTIPSSKARRNSKMSKNIKPQKNINGFIAFRSFYSRLVTRPDHQRQLSILLGKLWMNDPNKSIWNRYAIEYNAKLRCGSETTQPFVEWLCGCLNLDISGNKDEDDNLSIVRNSSWAFSSNNPVNIVEDIYITWQ